MNLAKFNELKANPCYTSFNGTLEEQLKEAEEDIQKRNLPMKNEIIDLIKKYGNFRFDRIESISKDKISFYFLPLHNFCPYWEIFNETAVYIGEYKNSSCGSSPKIESVEKFYMLSNGAFYNQDKKKIADNDENLFEYILTVEYDHHAPILESTYQRLREAGWYEGRKVDISRLIRECAENDVVLTESQKRFVEEFGGIAGKCTDGQCFSIFGERKYDYFKSINTEYSNNNLICEEYGKDTILVGNCYDNEVKIWLTGDGRMLTDQIDIVPCGRTVMEGFNVLLGD